ncbi:hypothetical protein [Fulvivirga aurantia]|uniref:hypothetical protein n=1 Tax=Fulvivirga aurantia TaxID=2529383 RepID=UPI001CA39786|nr:hypothetical protein [Fulvivirga aurantia]
MTETLEKEQLQKLLQFENEDMLSRFTDMYNVSEDEARDILKETLKFLYISQIPGTFIPDDLLIIDEMWHNMILFTPQYHEFSQQHFQKYFHHVPASKQEKAEREKSLMADHEKARQDYLDKLQTLISVTYDHLGEETVKKWFQEYPEKYSKQNIKALRR